MEIDVALLSRLQFAMTVMFHYIFPPLTIGLGLVMVIQEAVYLKTRKLEDLAAVRYWTQLFAISFTAGVASGITMAFQFGTNWAAYSRHVGDVFGAPLAIEAIGAFFLESCFLGLVLFGWKRISPKLHFISTVIVFFGALLSGLWIIVANSWQQTPAGHEIVEVIRGGETFNRAQIIDFWAMVFNPSTVDRYLHVVLGAFMMGAFFVMSVCAWHILKKQHLEFAKKSFVLALVIGLIVSVLQFWSGHANAVMVSKEQPLKLAAFEGMFKSGPAPFTLFGIPCDRNEKVYLELAIPGGTSFLATGSFRTEMIGLDRIDKSLRPPVFIPFVTYHMMAGLGAAMLGLVVLGGAMLLSRNLFNQRWLMWLFLFGALAPFAANQLGWAAAEVGRQPWVVYPTMLRDTIGNPIFDASGMLQFTQPGLLTKHAISETVKMGEVLFSLVLFGAIYTLMGLCWAYVMARKIHAGPEQLTPETPQETTY